MFIYTQFQKQLQVMIRASFQGGGIEGPRPVENPEAQKSSPEGPKTPEEANQLSEDARNTADKLRADTEAAREQGERIRGDNHPHNPDLGLPNNRENTMEHSENRETFGTSQENMRDVADKYGIDVDLAEASEEGNDSIGQEPGIDGSQVGRISERVSELQSNLANPTFSEAEKKQIQQEIPALAAFLNILTGGSLNPRNTPAGTVGSGGEAYPGGIGEPLSPELLERYGGTGHELASWLQNSGFPVYEGKPFYCGKNVGEALNNFGIEGLPQSGRNGKDWAQICADRPDQFKQIQVTPQEAPAGALISYQANTGGSEARQKYGHIEVALGNNKGFYYGTVANNPGGSNSNFKEGTYSVWMPVSKTA